MDFAPSSFKCDDHPFVRYYHPAEAAACLGWPNWVVLPAAFDRAWKVVGNGLSTAHAMTGFIQMHLLLGEQSRFKNVPGIVEALANDDQECDQFQRILTLPLMISCPLFRRTLKAFIHPSRILQVDLTDLRMTSRSRNLTPWMMLKVVGKEVLMQPLKLALRFLSLLMREEYLGNMKRFRSLINKLRMMVPDDQTLMVYLCSAIAHKAFDEPINNPAPFVVSCMSRRWVSVGWIAAKPKVEDVLQEVLPHAKSEHFMTFQITNQDVHFDHVILSDKAVVKVLAKRISSNCSQIGNHMKWTIQVEVTTNIGEVMAHIAFHLEVTPTDLVMTWKGRSLYEKDFVLAFPDIVFQDFWQPRIQSIPRCIL